MKLNKPRCLQMFVVWNLIFLTALELLNKYFDCAQRKQRIECMNVYLRAAHRLPASKADTKFAKLF